MDFEDEDNEREVKTKKPKFPLCMYISEGSKYMKLHLYDKAIVCYSTALEQEPGDVKSLIGRAKCYIRLGKYEDAKVDAEAILTSNSKSVEANSLKGEAEYFMRDFERAFLTYNRARAFKPNSVALKSGQQLCRSAISNALDKDEDFVLDEGDVEDIALLLSGEQLENRTLGCFSQSDKFSSDIECVCKLLSDESVKSVHPDCRYLLAYLRDHQAFWRDQRPRKKMYY